MEAYHNCLHCMNKRVRIMTVDGNHYEGVITNVDRENVYLDTRGERRSVQTSAFYPGYGYGYGAGAGILSLSLFTLLALALI